MSENLKSLSSVSFNSNDINNNNKEALPSYDTCDKMYDESLFENNKKTCITLKTFYEVIEEFVGSEDIETQKFSNDYKVDVFLNKKKYYRIYGCAVDGKNICYRDVLVRLFRYAVDGSKLEREELDKNFTNSYGEFNFLMECKNDFQEYKVEIDSWYREF